MGQVLDLAEAVSAASSARLTAIDGLPDLSEVGGQLVAPRALEVASGSGKLKIMRNDILHLLTALLEIQPEWRVAYGQLWIGPGLVLTSACAAGRGSCGAGLVPPSGFRRLPSVQSSGTKPNPFSACL